MTLRDQKKSYTDFISRLENENLKKMWEKDTNFKEKFFDYIYDDLLNIDKPNILEFGVHAGFSTSLFLDATVRHASKKIPSVNLITLALCIA